MSQEGSWRDIMDREKFWQFRGLRSVHEGEAAFSPSEQTNRAYRPVFRAAAGTWVRCAAPDRLREFRAATLRCVPNLSSAINGSIFFY